MECGFDERKGESWRTDEKREEQDGPAGWTFEWKCNTKSCVAWDCKRCFYDDVFNEYGMPELTKIFCESDDVVYGALPGIRWGRTMTIGNGADVCDFCFYKKKNGRHAESVLQNNGLYRFIRRDF